MRQKIIFQEKVKFQIFISLIFSMSCSFVNSQPKPQVLSKKKFQVCGVSLDLEIADNNQSRSIGLMHRESVPKGTGMIFVFSKPEVLSFWMKNVPMDIDIGYFSESGRLLKFHTMKGTSPIQATERLPTYSSINPAKYAVEVEAGFYEKIKSPKDCELSPLVP
jgi:uncharacterized membrane protein (UPF0127 family)